MRLATRVLAAVLLILLLSSCTRSEALLWLVQRGDPQAQADRHELHYGDGLDSWEWQRYQNVADIANMLAYLRALEANKTPEQHVRDAAREFGIPEEAFVRVIRCESGMNPHAVGPPTSNGPGLGLGQHLRNFWSGRAAALGYGPGDWSNARANARVSAWLWSTGGPGHWECY